MAYVTLDGIINRTGYTDKKDWYLLVIKELFDNAIDWLWGEYPGSIDSKITCDITIDRINQLFRCKVRNTNPRNIPVFRNLHHIFNYEMTYGSKQNDFKISRGTLGDAMKYIAALPYVLTNLGRDKSNDFVDRQWEAPMYIRHNGIEQEVLILVDEDNSRIDARITLPDQAPPIPHTDTEIEVTYPLLARRFEGATEVRINEDTHEQEEVPLLELKTIADYCKQQKAGTTDISFDIQITDLIVVVAAAAAGGEEGSHPVVVPQVVRITQQAAHAISDQRWGSNMPSIKAYTPQEFRKKIFGVHDKTNTSVFRILQTFREGTRLKKRPDIDITISQLREEDPEKIRQLYYELREISNKKNKKNKKGSTARKKISLPYSHVAADLRTKGLIDNLADLYPVDTEKAKHRVIYGTVTDQSHDVEYEFAFEIIAIPVMEDLLRESPESYTTKFIGAINYSVSPKGNRFEGSYRWIKKSEKKKNNWNNDTEASSIEGILSQYGFSFASGVYNHQTTKLPCIVYGNLISKKLHYIGQSKTEVDTTQFAHKIIDAVKSIAQDIPTFRATEIRTPDFHMGSSGGSFRFSIPRTRKPLVIKPERVSMFDVVYERLKDRIDLVKEKGRAWTGDMHTQQSLWYNALPLINQYVNEGKLKKPKNRNNFLDQITKVCNLYEVRREDVGIVAGAYSTMYYNGKWSAVNFEDIEALARNGTDIVFIEKQDIVQSLGRHASKNGVALVNSKGHLSQYAKDLSDAAEQGGAHIAILTDYDIPGLHIASKLKRGLWLGVDEPMLARFGITHDDKDWVIPYDPQTGIGDDVIKRDIESDERFSLLDRVDMDWLKQHKRSKVEGGGKDPGHKVEIDAVLAKAGSEGLWDYLRESLARKYPKRNYARVIDSYKYAPIPSTTGYTDPPIIGLVRLYIRNRADSITKQRREDIGRELKDYEGFLVVQDKDNAIRKDLTGIVYGDRQLNDITSVLSQVAESVSEEVTEAIVSAIKKLDEEKGYGIMKALGTNKESSQS